MPSDGPAAAVLVAWAAVDLLQVPLVAAVFASFRLARRLGALWRAVALCFGAYAAWVVITARFVPFAPSGWAVFLLGMLLDPRRETAPERVWALGSAVAVGLFWAVPVAVAWRFGPGLLRARARARRAG